MKDKANEMRLTAKLYRLLSNPIIKSIQIYCKNIERLIDDVFECQFAMMIQEDSINSLNQLIRGRLLCVIHSDLFCDFNLSIRCLLFLRRIEVIDQQFSQALAYLIDISLHVSYIPESADYQRSKSIDLHLATWLEA